MLGLLVATLAACEPARDPGPCAETTFDSAGNTLTVSDSSIRITQRLAQQGQLLMTRRLLVLGAPKTIDPRNPDGGIL